MKTHPLLSTFCAAVLLGASASAQNTNGLMDISKLESKSVTNLQNENLGDIEQILVDPQSGRIRYAVIELDKLWQIDDPEIAVPFGALKFKRQANNDFTVQLDADKAKLERAPKFKVGDADRLYQRNASQPVYSYWAIVWTDDPATQSGSSTAGNQNRQGTQSGQSAGAQSGQSAGARSGQSGTSGSVSQEPSTGAASTPSTSPATGSTTTGSGTSTGATGGSGTSGSGTSSSANPTGSTPSTSGSTNPSPAGQPNTQSATP